MTMAYMTFGNWQLLKYKRGEEADLYSAFIEVPYTQGAQVQITQCYLSANYTVPASTS